MKEHLRRRGQGGRRKVRECRATEVFQEAGNG